MALDLGTREMGYAMLESNNLLFFGIHTFKDRRSSGAILSDAEAFIGKLESAFSPDLFVIEKLGANSRRSPRLQKVGHGLKLLARRRHLAVMSLDPTQVRHIIVGYPDATKLDVAKTIVDWFPYLERYLRTDLRTHEKYWENMFDAVALGVAAHEIVTRDRVIAALTPSRT